MNRVIVIGLDAADAELIELWSDEGHLPTMAALRTQGLWSRLGTTAEVMHVSAWPTIYTGARPGHHGMYHAYQVRAGDQRVHRALPEWCALPPFWKFLDDAGRRCIVLDAFMDYRLEGFGGVQILEYGTWTWFSEPGSTPSNARREIVRRFGAYPGPEHTKVFTVPDPVWFRDRLVEGARTKAAVTRWLLEEHPWDMAFVTFGEPHGAGHYLWHMGDPDYPSYPAAGTPGAERPLLDVYVAVDSAIGHILEALDDDVTVIVTSGDGMGPNLAGCQHLPKALNRLGLYFAADVADETSTTGRASRKSMAAVLREAIPLSVRHAVTRCIPRSLQYRLSMKWANADIDWARSSAFCIPNANEGYIRINLNGREPEGIVESPHAYEELLDELVKQMGALTNPHNGRQAADRIFRTDDVFPGPERHHLPDLVVTWNPDARIGAELESEAVGSIVGKAAHETSPYYTGNHRPTAFVLARGPHVSAEAAVTDGHIVDIAPTIFALLGVDPPAHFEGRPWAELVE